MARTALLVKTERGQKAAEQAVANKKKPSHPTRVYNRCKKCGKVRGFMRKFDTCRICFRELAKEGKITGVKKSSW